MDRIDFILPWVDGGDPAWREEFSRWSGVPGGDGSGARYRDWDNLRYWFRGVEKFAPWAGRVHFITWGHLPPWLVRDNPRLNVVCHRDYIPGDYLPTFSSHTIELNMHRIDGLSERFVYFNDDTFLTGPVGAERFFRGGLPCDMARLGIVQPGPGAAYDMNDTEVINRRHRKNRAMRRHPCKWFNVRYTPGDMLKTFSLMAYERFPGMKQTHMPQPFLKETFERLWREEPEVLGETCRNRVRMPGDVNQWLMRMEQLARGDFSPHGQGDTLLETIGEGSIERICRAVESGRYSMLCLNDSNVIEHFEELKQRLNASFRRILPEKSYFEK